MESEQKTSKKEGILHGILFSFVLSLVPAILLAVLFYEIFPNFFSENINPLYDLLISQIICMIIIFSVRNLIFKSMQNLDDRIKQIKPAVSATSFLPTLEQEKMFIKNAIKQVFIVQLIALLFFVLSIIYQDQDLFLIWLGVVIFLSGFICSVLFNKLIGVPGFIKYTFNIIELNMGLVILVFVLLWSGILKLWAWGNVLSTIPLFIPVIIGALLIAVWGFRFSRTYVEKQKTPLILYAIVFFFWTIVLFFTKDVIPLDALELSHLFS